MNEITNKNELVEVSGGFISLGIAAAIASGIVFLIGVVDGYTRPLRCRRY